MTAATLLMTAPEGGGGSIWGTVFMFAAIFAIFYFLLIRPQRKQQEEHEEMVKALDKGDRVVTGGGVVGEVIHAEDQILTVKTADGTRLEVRRGTVAQKIDGEDGE